MTSPFDAVASRTVELRHDDGSATPVVVRIARPQEDRSDWRCEFEIEGLSKTRRLHAMGVDGIQALWLALVRAGVDLRFSDEGKLGRLAFHGEADLGFPPPEYVADPEWHVFTVDGQDLWWRRHPSFQREETGTWRRSWSLEVARRPGALGVGTYHSFDTVVGVEHARELVRLAREQGMPLV